MPKTHARKIPEGLRAQAQQVHVNCLPLDAKAFARHLFLTRDAAEEQLGRILAEQGQDAVCRWLIPILMDWESICKPLAHKDQDKVLWRIGSRPLFAGWWLGMGSEVHSDVQVEFVQSAKWVSAAIPARYLPGEALDTGYYMWWDFLASDILEGTPVSDLCLDVLEELLNNPDQRVQACALHGLGHLRHARRPAVVDKWIESRPEVKNDPWVLQCRNGTVA